MAWAVFLVGVSFFSLPAAQLLIEGWIVLIIFSIYVFAVRTFKLSGDHYFRYLGSAYLGVAFVESVQFLSFPGLGIFSEAISTHSMQFWLVARFLQALIILFAPFAVRLRAGRFWWVLISVAIGVALVLPVLMTGHSSANIVTRVGIPPFSRYLELVICLMLAGAAIKLIKVYRAGCRKQPGQITGPGNARVMLISIAVIIVAELLQIVIGARDGWVIIASHLLVVGSLYIVLEGLLFRGLDVPVGLISRSKSQLEAAMGAAADGLLINDLTGQVIAANMRFKTMACISFDPGRDQNASEMLLSIINNAVAPVPLLARTDELMNSTRSEGFERFVMKDGRVFEMFSYPYYFDGRIDGRVWSFRDVSLRERATTQLEISSRRMDNILVAAGEGMFEINLDTGTVWAHPNWSSVVGCRPDEVPSSLVDLEKLFHPDDLPHVQREMRLLYRKLGEFRVEFRMADISGAWRWFLAVGRVDVFESGRILLGVQRDITSEKTREAEIRRQRGLMEAFIENMPLGAFVKEVSSGRYVIWNNSLARLSGVIPSQVIGRRDDEIFGAELAPRLAKSDEEVVKQGVSVVIENSWIGEASGRNIRLRKVPVIDADRVVRLIIGVVEDVTQQQQMERLILRSRSMESLGRLAGGIAHDFNNILQVIIGNAESLRTGIVTGGSSRPDGGPVVTEDVDQILEAGDRAMELIRQLLTFSRQDSMTAEVIDLDTVVSDMMKMLGRVIGADITTEVKLSGQSVSVMAERSRIEQIVMNLTVNASDAMPYGGNLLVQTGRTVVDEVFAVLHPGSIPGEYAMISVRDTGIGIPREVLEHIYEPFFSTKGVGKGTGLGLSTVYGIVDSLNGFMLVESQSGKGTEFSVFLPLQVSRVPDRVAADAVSENASDQVSDKPRTVLLAESDEAVMAASSHVLSRAGYRVIQASSGPEVLQRLWEIDKNGGVDLLILDVVMAGMGGRDIYDRYRADHPGTPVLFCSGDSSVMIEQPYLDETGAILLRKPYIGRQLLFAVRSLLQAHLNKKAEKVKKS